MLADGLHIGTGVSAINPLLPNKTRLAKAVADAIGEGSKQALLALVEQFDYDYKQEKQTLERELACLNYQLVETFDHAGTQAILATNDHHVVLAFRGTEANSIQDIKTDANAVQQTCKTGGKIHSGFDKAYKQVAQDIDKALAADALADKPLFITGHSLGGALATIAAKKITHKGGNAGCYTFGAPRIGDEEWISNIKTPVYRLVNAADCITMMPPGEMGIRFIAVPLGFIPYIGKPVKAWLLSRFNYMHGGNMRYLTNCEKNAYGDVKLLYSVSWFYRIKAFVMKKLPWRKFLADHSISIYRKKLMVIAERRNKQGESG